MKLTDHFNKYVGREVYDPGRMTCDWDPVAAEIEKVAKKIGFEDVRFLKPNAVTTGKYRENRLNVRIEKGTDKNRCVKWHIKHFSIG